MFKYLELSTKKRVGYIILNRIDKKNALNFSFVSEIKQALEKYLNDENIKVVVLKSNCDVFSAGADLEALYKMQNYTYEDNLKDSENLKDLFLQIYNYPKIVISQVEGHAIAGGCGLATICDFCFSIPEAKFGYTEVKIGFIPALVSVFLIRKLGENKAKELLLTGELISATKAKEYNLIYNIVENETIEDEVYNFATKIANTTSINSIAQTKKLMLESWHLHIEESMALAAKYNAEVRNSDDCKKGVSAFLNKENFVW